MDHSQSTAYIVLSQFMNNYIFLPSPSDNKYYGTKVVHLIRGTIPICSWNGSLSIPNTILYLLFCILVVFMILPTYSKHIWYRVQHCATHIPLICTYTSSFILIFSCLHTSILRVESGFISNLFVGILDIVNKRRRDVVLIHTRLPQSSLYTLCGYLKLINFLFVIVAILSLW